MHLFLLHFAIYLLCAGCETKNIECGSISFDILAERGKLHVGLQPMKVIRSLCGNCKFIVKFCLS